MSDFANVLFNVGAPLGLYNNSTAHANGATHVL
jgi:hypothetical protein